MTCRRRRHNRPPVSPSCKRRRDEPHRCVRARNRYSAPPPNRVKAWQPPSRNGSNRRGSGWLRPHPHRARRRMYSVLLLHLSLRGETPRRISTLVSVSVRRVSGKASPPRQRRGHRPAYNGRPMPPPSQETAPRPLSKSVSARRANGRLPVRQRRGHRPACSVRRPRRKSVSRRAVSRRLSKTVSARRAKSRLLGRLLPRQRRTHRRVCNAPLLNRRNHRHRRAVSRRPLRSVSARRVNVERMRRQRRVHRQACSARLPRLRNQKAAELRPSKNTPARRASVRLVHRHRQRRRRVCNARRPHRRRFSVRRSRPRPNQEWPHADVERELPASPSAEPDASGYSATAAIAERIRQARVQRTTETPEPTPDVTPGETLQPTLRSSADPESTTYSRSAAISERIRQARVQRSGGDTGLTTSAQPGDTNYSRAAEMRSRLAAVRGEAPDQVQRAPAETDSAPPSAPEPTSPTPESSTDAPIQTSTPGEGTPTVQRAVSEGAEEAAEDEPEPPSQAAALHARIDAARARLSGGEYTPPPGGEVVQRETETRPLVARQLRTQPTAMESLGAARSGSPAQTRRTRAMSRTQVLTPERKTGDFTAGEETGQRSSGASTANVQRTPASPPSPPVTIDSTATPVEQPSAPEVQRSVEDTPVAEEAQSVEPSTAPPAEQSFHAGSATQRRRHACRSRNKFG